MYNRFAKPSLDEILKYPAPTIVWAPIRQGVVSTVSFGQASYNIYLTLYLLTFRTLHQHALILDGSFTTNTPGYSIYKHRFSMVHALMYAMDDYILYARRKRTVVNGTTFGCAPNQGSSGNRDNISQRIYDDLSQYYEGQVCFIYKYNAHNIFLPFTFNLHFKQPLQIENVMDIQNNNVTIDVV